MSNATVTKYRRLLDYEADAHEKVVRSLVSVPVERRDSPEYRRAVTILAHLVAARRIWLGRIGAIPADVPTMFPTDVDLAGVKTSLREIHNLWTAYLGRLNDDDIDQWFEYQSLDSGRFRSRIEDILTQLYGHSLYHRGQIAMLVRSAGGEPAATDFVYWSREPI